jgi:hypothetical protein
MEKHPHSELIDTLGPEAVRRALAITPAVLWNWRHRGVATGQRLAFAKLLIARGLDVPADILDAVTVQSLRLACAVREVAVIDTGKPIAMTGEGFAA